MAVMLHGVYLASPMREDGSYEAPGFMGIFSNGLFQEFDQPGIYSFIIPEGITKIRVRTVGRGNVGTHSPGYYTSAGAGGGYAHGVFDVAPGEIFEVKVPSWRYNTLTEASFGNAARGLLIRATNGGAYNVPGTGYGGDYQSTGGVSGASNNSSHYGTGAAGSQVALVGGKGTISMYATDVAAGGVGGNANGGRAGGANGPATSGAQGPGVSLTGLPLPPGFPRFKFDGFWGAGSSGLPGGGGTNTNRIGGIGAGWHNSAAVDNNSVIYGAAPTTGFAANRFNGGTADARGLVVIEW